MKPLSATAALFVIGIGLALPGCAVVRVPVKVAGTVVGGTILAVTRGPARPADLNGRPRGG
ncbi:hypothetical protein OCGS_1688 [Oceaniovalibus guishaninsula JLT2003]|uniref:Uncharacterized protein n=1 Tax=Oceaniovalibus guishaninsula JLT2003 TaxID=1231392 RepID=K2HC46_9RHOB|nr:hypothetical protein [Oceaniovalibus guishaninsula]EKE44172.1 hypothetical protein OCGS_1688 [Oceaniovalibus guishaninsula JLT2003]